MTNIKNRYLSRAKLKRLHAMRKINLINEMEATKAKQIKASLSLRYVGLVLVQGSSALALLSFPMINYWVALWCGLVCYQITAVVFYREDNRIYQQTKIKYARGTGSSKETVTALAIKRKREIVYIIGNTIGLILIGINIILSL